MADDGGEGEEEEWVSTKGELFLIMAEEYNHYSEAI